MLPGLAALLAVCASTFAELDKDDPAAELASFKLPPGFQGNLFASEKDGVVKPIQMRWDPRGRLWVIQSTTYPQLKPGEEPNDKVLILEDTNGDGVSDKTTVFADGLMIPTGLEIAPTPQPGGLADISPGRLPGVNGNIEPRPGGALEPSAAPAGADTTTDATPRVSPGANIRQPSGLKTDGATPSLSACYVGEGTKLLLLTDTDGDGKCDKREVVLRGFGTGDNHQNINSFRWSPGGELFFSQGLHAHARIETAHGIVPLDEAGFWRYRPREGRLDSFYGGPADPQNPWGFVWNDWGQMFMVAGNNGGIYWPLPEMIRGYRYGRRDSVWVNARGRKSSGPDIVGTAHLPPEWQGVFLSGGYINNAVWALDMHDDGAGFKLIDREPLVRSTHGSFRPVDVKIGPDGAIYLCDWYNPIIGHYQASFRHPDRDKTHGRIWRITYKGRPLVKTPKIAGAKLEELFENLKSGERWVREMTRLELMGRKTEEVVPALKEWWRKFLPEGWGKDTEVKFDPKLVPYLFEALCVFESHDAPEIRLLDLLSTANRDARAYAASIQARWHSRLDLAAAANGVEESDNTMKGIRSYRAALDSDPRVRVADIVGSVDTSRMNATIAITSPNHKGDKFIDLAARSALSIVKLEASDISGHSGDWSQNLERLAELQRPPGSPKSAPSAKSADKITATVPATGKLRATPEFVAALVQEVRESGDAKHGGEVFRRAELACTACHSIADQGGKIGPPLDTIGSGQPVDFIIGATLEPQREIKESYEALQLTAKDGRTALGYLAARDPQHTTIRDPATGAETKFANADIQEQKQVGSFMPAALVDNLSREDLRDLFRYLSELGKPKP